MQLFLSGLGTDVVALCRMKRLWDRHGSKGVLRFLHKQELDYCLRYKDPVPHIAGRFAAKEAVAKALRSGIGAQLGWLDIEVGVDSLGAPFVDLSAQARAYFNQPTIFLSISHCHLVATATAISLKAKAEESPVEGEHLSEQALLSLEELEGSDV